MRCGLETRIGTSDSFPALRPPARSCTIRGGRFPHTLAIDDAERSGQFETAQVRGRLVSSWAHAQAEAALHSTPRPGGPGQVVFVTIDRATGRSERPVLSGVSIIIPVFNRIEFTTQCLDRIWRNTGPTIPFEVIVIDNGSRDRTAATLTDPAVSGRIRYQRNDENLGFARSCNLGATLARYDKLLFLNNDTLVQEGWLDSMVRLIERDDRVGIVGIKQLFPYTNLIHHTGIIFTAGGRPQHIYPHADASLGHVNKQREYQAVNGACMLVPRRVFEECGGFDEEYVNGYEDVDLCLSVRAHGRKVMCCTDAFIYHYGQITETRTADDDQNAERFKAKWGTRVVADELRYLREDKSDLARVNRPVPSSSSRKALPDDAIYFADDLSRGSALTWAIIELAGALESIGVPVFVGPGEITNTVSSDARERLRSLRLPRAPSGGTQIKWSHYWPGHLSLDLDGRLNLEFFVINYQFGAPGSQPWDRWLQCLTQNHYVKLPLSRFCKDVLRQVGVPDDLCHIVPLGYAREAESVAPPRRTSKDFRFLVVTNSHDLERYGTKLALDAYWSAFSAADPVVMVVKDYGVGAADATLRDLLRSPAHRARVEYIAEFTGKARLIEIYKSCDVFVSPHRGEGFGMKILDAMACGLPVVTPLYGGPTDFCTPQNTLPVDFQLVPVGPCLDSQSLAITNQPLWCEPDPDSLARQLRAACDNREVTRRVADRGRHEVADRWTWKRSAARLKQVTDDLRGSRPSVVSVASPAPAADHPARPWLDVRVSVVIPTFNRKDQLLTALAALECQTVLPQEFEVIIVDDGSTDGTADALKDRQFPFRLVTLTQPNQGPGAARNHAVARASGHLILFLGDDVIAHEQLIEQHLVAHTRLPGVSAAVLGHVDWPPHMKPNAVMQFVCGEGTLQFAYHYIPTLPALDFRFFYTTNISLKRSFLVDAARDGIEFDSCFTYAAFEDSELAYRLERRGLTIHYAQDAWAYHDHRMDLDGFCRREHLVGQMAVVFYRKHPALDPLLEVSWLGNLVRVVGRLLEDPELLAKIRSLDEATDAFLVSLERSLEELFELEDQTAATSAGQDSLERREQRRPTLHGVLATIFDAHRTRGKVEEWYRGVLDRKQIEVAKVLAACTRKLQFLRSSATEFPRLSREIAWLDNNLVEGIRRRAAELDGRLGGVLTPADVPVALAPRRRLVGGRALAWMRRTDVYIQTQLGNGNRGPWLARYQRLREDVKRLMR